MLSTYSEGSVPSRGSSTRFFAKGFSFLWGGWVLVVEPAVDVIWMKQDSHSCSMLCGVRVLKWGFVVSVAWPVRCVALSAGMLSPARVLRGSVVLVRVPLQGSRGNPAVFWLVFFFADIFFAVIRVLCYYM